MRAIMRGMGPAVIGVLAVSLVRLAPAALPDVFAVVILVATVTAMVALRVSTFRVMIAGAALGVLRNYLPVFRGVRAAGRLIVS
jgi:chromate transporter